MAALGILATRASAQQVFVVDARGGAFSTTIQPAVDAASPGDVILVRPGTYPAFGVGKGVSVLGGPLVRVGGGIAVAAIPRGQTLTLRGFAPADPALLVNLGGAGADGGHVHLEDIETSTPFSLLPSLHVRSNAQVSLLNVVARGGAQLVGQVVATQCTFLGSDGADSRPAGSGLSASGDVRLTQCACIGGNDFGFGAPGAGLNVTGDVVRLYGGPGMTVRAGIAPFSTTVQTAIRGGPGTVELDPDTSLTPWNGAPPVVGFGLRVVTRTAPSLTATRDQTRTQIRLRVRAPEATAAVMMLGLASQPPLPSPFGTLWLDPAQPILTVDSGSISGTRDKVLVVPQAPPWLTLVAQAGAVSATGLTLTNPTVLTFYP